MAIYGDVFVSVYSPTNLTTPKTVIDNGRSINYVHCLSASGTFEVNGTGFGSATFDFKDRDVYPLISRGDHIHIYQHSALVPGNLTIARFIAKRIKPSADANGGTHVIEGPGTLRELQDRTVKQLVIDDGAGGKATNDITQALSYATYTWTCTQPGTPNGGGYLTIQKQSVWDAVLQLAGQAGINIRYKHPRQVELITPASSGLTLIKGGPEAQELIQGANRLAYAPLLSLSRDLDTNEYFTRAYIEGAKTGETALGISDMDHSAITVPEGYDIYWSSNLIVNTTAETASGMIIEAYLEFPEIKAAEDGSVPKQSAQEQLLAAALNRIEAATTNDYRFQVSTICHIDPKPGDTIFLNYTEDVNGEVTFAALGTFYIYKVTHSVAVGKDERETVMELGVSEIPPAESDGSTAIAKTLKQINAKVDNATGTFPAGSSPSAGDHGSLTGLEDDDHAQYLLANGTRQLGGNLAVATDVTIDGVDISAHAANPAAHHPVVTLISPLTDVPSALTLNTGEQKLTFALGIGKGLTASSGRIIEMRTPGTLSYQSINKVDSTNHTHQVSSTSDGQTYAPTILASSTAGGLRLTSIGLGTPPNTGNPGQLDLTGNIYFHLNKAITSGGATITISPQNHLYLFPTGKSVIQGSNIDLQPTGAGLINAFSNLAFQGQKSITTTADQLILAPSTDLRLEPGSGAKVLVLNDRTIELDGFNAGFLGNGWRIDGDGNAEFRRIYADEMRVTLFTAESAVANGRALYVTPGTSKLTQDFVIPATIGAYATISVEDIPGAAGFAVFGNLSYVMLRYFNWQTPAEGGHLELISVWGQVDQYTNVSQSSRQTYRFKLMSCDAAARGEKLEKGTPVIGFGTTGSGWDELTAGDASSDPNSPALRVRTWGGQTVPDVPWDEDNRQLRALVGNLYGITAVSGEFGIYAGEGTGLSDSHLIFSNLQASLYNTTAKSYQNGELVYQMDPAVPSIALGSGFGIPAGPISGGDGFWTGLENAQWKVRIGGTPNSNKPQLVWTGQDLVFRDSSGEDVIKLSSTGVSTFENAIYIGEQGAVSAGNFDDGRVSFDPQGLKLYTGYGGDIDPTVTQTDSAAALSFYADGLTASIYNNGDALGHAMYYKHRTNRPGTEPLYLSTYFGTAGTNVAASIRQEMYNGQAATAAMEFLINGIRKMRVEPTGVLIDQIQLANTGGTSSLYVPNPPSGSIKIFNYAGNLYLKNSSGNAYRVALV